MRHTGRISGILNKIKGTETERESCLQAVEKAGLWQKVQYTEWMRNQTGEWLEKLTAGDLTALRVVYGAFATDDAALISCAGEAVGGMLRGMDRAQLLKLCGQFRDCTSMEWTVDWAEVSPEFLKSVLEEEVYRYVLILGSFHPNGYFREKCMYEMAGYGGMLFWLFFRVNDWVQEIREGACGILEAYLKKADAGELFDGLPAFERLQNCRRRTEAQMGRLWEQVEDRMSLALGEIEIREIPHMEPCVRSALYRLVVRSSSLTLQEMDALLQREKISSLKRILTGGILGRPDCTPERVEGYLADSSAVIRRMAVEYKYEHLRDSWPGLERMLLDSGRGVRGYAVYILERHGNLDIRGYYLEHLEDGRPEHAILGLGEYSRRGNLEKLTECLGRPERKILKSTLLALGYQEDFQDGELLWAYLLDERNDISKAAYLSMRKRDLHPGAERIYDAYGQAGEDHRRRYLLELLLREGSWNRLPWLIRLYRRNLPEERKRKILDGISCRFMYGRLSQPLRQDIFRALEENGGQLPEGVKKGILYDMKFL